MAEMARRILHDIVYYILAKLPRDIHLETQVSLQVTGLNNLRSLFR